MGTATVCNEGEETSSAKALTSKSGVVPVFDIVRGSRLRYRGKVYEVLTLGDGPQRLNSLGARKYNGTVSCLGDVLVKDVTVPLNAYAIEVMYGRTKDGHTKPGEIEMETWDEQDHDQEQHHTLRGL